MNSPPPKETASAKTPFKSYLKTTSGTKFSTLIDDQVKSEILDRVDLVALISPHVQLKKAGNRHYGLCPFHDEKTASFAVHAEKNFYFCFGCHASGDAIGFLMRYHGLKFSEAVKQLADLVGVEIPKGVPVSRRVIQRRIDAEAMLGLMENELLICAIVTGDYARGVHVSDDDRRRFLRAVNHITNAIEFVKKRRLFDHERQQMNVRETEETAV